MYLNPPTLEDLRFEKYGCEAPTRNMAAALDVLVKYYNYIDTTEVRPLTTPVHHLDYSFLENLALIHLGNSAANSTLKT